MSDGAADEFGTLERHGDVSVLRYERRLAHPRERVWRAITEDADLAAWFPTTIEGPRAAAHRSASRSARARRSPSTARCSPSTRRH